MAKILFGAGVADARNKLGGHVFSKNRSGAYLRMKVSPSQPRSTKQLNVRANFGALSKAWGMDLTQVQRDSWAALASVNPVPDQFGNPQVLTGANFYQRVNRNLFSINEPRMDDAPIDQAVDAIVSVSVAAQVSGDILVLTFVPQTVDPDFTLVVQATPPVSPGKSFVTPLLKQVATLDFGAGGSPFDFFTAYHDVFGNLQETQKLAVNVFTINKTNGAASTPASASAIILL